MSSNIIVSQMGNFLLYCLLQVAVTHFYDVPSVGVCLIYVAFLILLPHTLTYLSTLLCIAFGTGLLADLWFNSWGVHAFASVLLVYTRSIFLSFILPNTVRNGAVVEPSVLNLGWALFPFFAFILVVVHHTAVILLDTNSPWLFLWAIRKIAASTCLTYFMVLAIQMLMLMQLVMRR